MSKINIYLDIDKNKTGYSVWEDSKLVKYGLIKDFRYNNKLIGKYKNGKYKYLKVKRKDIDASKNFSFELRDQIQWEYWDQVQIFFEVSWQVNEKLIWIGRCLQETQTAFNRFLDIEVEEFPINTIAWKSFIKKEAIKKKVPSYIFNNNKDLSIWFANTIVKGDKITNDDVADAINMGYYNEKKEVK